MLPKAHYFRVSPIQDREYIIQELQNKVFCLSFHVLQRLADFLKCPQIVLKCIVVNPDKEAANI
jgi:hypothetical protein